jgi:hypothetical protein
MSNLFKKALAALKETKNLDTVLAGSGFLDEGTYTFIVQAIDSSEIGQNKVTITYATPEGQAYTDRAFFANKDGTSIGKSIRFLISGCTPDSESFASILAALDTDDGALEMLTGMKLQATLKRSPGFHVHATATGEYAAFDGPNAETAKKLTGDFADVADARGAAKAMGLKQSFVNISSVKATHAEENAATLAKVIAARGKGATVSKVKTAI